MIMALAVAFIVLLLSTVVVAQSIHSLDSSGYDRERLLSVNAAEAGTNYWYAFLETTPPGTMATNAGCNGGTGNAHDRRGRAVGTVGRRVQRRRHVLRGRRRPR